MFFKIIEEAKTEFQFTVFSYVLMSNHYHILAEIKQPNLSQIMQFVNASYGVYFNSDKSR
jgi:putative transposase